MSYVHQCANKIGGGGRHCTLASHPKTNIFPSCFSNGNTGWERPENSCSTLLQIHLLQVMIQDNKRAAEMIRIFMLVQTLLNVHSWQNSQFGFRCDWVWIFLDVVDSKQMLGNIYNSIDLHPNLSWYCLKGIRFGGCENEENWQTDHKEIQRREP